MNHTISIITICFNNLSDVIKTCESVDGQQQLPYEHIIIDGSTNTAIKNYLEAHKQPIYRKWYCELDEGIADAFNKGVLKATGDILVMLNSGDTLYDKTVLEKVDHIFEADPHLMWCNGKMNLFRGKRWVIVGKKFDKAQLYKGMRAIFHPTMYVKKEVYDRYGLYDKSFKIAMDYDFLCRIADEKNKFINYPLAAFDAAGVSTVNYLNALKEMSLAYRKNFKQSVKHRFWMYRLTLMHYLLESNIGRWLYKWKVKLGMENI